MTQDIRPGKTCLLSSVSNAWRHMGRCVTEPILFLLGRGNRVQCRIEQRNGAPLAFVGHHSAEILARFCEDRGVGHRLVRGRADLGGLEAELQLQLAAGNRPIAWVEMSLLPYIDLVVPPGSMHAVAIEEVDEAQVTIADCYVTSGLYSQAVRTHRVRLPLERFAAWERTSYLHHQIDYQALSEGFSLDDIEAREGFVAAAYDFVGRGDGSAGTAATLLDFASQLPALHAASDTEARQHLFGSLAYSLRYFGTLWSREFLSELLRAHAPPARQIELSAIAAELSGASRRWKSIMFMALKLASAKDGARAVDALHARMQAAVQHEVRVYTRLLELLPSTAPAGPWRPLPAADAAHVTRFGFDAGH